MSYYRTSTIGGRTASGAYVNTCRRGHYTSASACRVATRLGITHDAKMTHATTDLSGKGRGSEDGRYALDIMRGTATKISGHVEIDDSGEIHEISNAIEGR